MAPPNDNVRRLADDFYAAKIAVAEAEERLAKIRKQILDTDLSVLTGDVAVVTVDVSRIVRLDINKAREVLTPKQLAACTASKETIFVRCKAKTRR